MWRWGSGEGEGEGERRELHAPIHQEHVCLDSSGVKGYVRVCDEAENGPFPPMPSITVLSSSEMSSLCASKRIRIRSDRSANLKRVVHPITTLKRAVSSWSRPYRVRENISFQVRGACACRRGSESGPTVPSKGPTAVQEVRFMRSANLTLPPKTSASGI